MVNLVRRFKHRLLIRQIEELSPFQKALYKHISEATIKNRN